MAKLYELVQDFATLQDMAENGEDVYDTLESIDLAIEDKLENVGKVIRNLESEAKAHKDEEKRLADKRKSIENEVKNLKQYAENAMKETGKRKVDAGLFKFNIQKNPPSVNITDEDLIPKDYYVPTEPKLDKDAIKEKLKNGESVPGVELTQSEGVRFK